MGSRAESSGLTLTAQDAALIRGMVLRGDRHHDIAAFFGVNQGRIAEIKDGIRFADCWRPSSISRSDSCSAIRLAWHPGSMTKQMQGRSKRLLRRRTIGSPASARITPES